MDLESISPLNAVSLEERTTDSIRDLILERQLKPGTHLTEIILSESLQVSRAVIRTAFQQLRHEGLLERRPNKGMFVVELSTKDVWEIYTLRNNLEILATRLVTKNIDGNKRFILSEVLKKMKVAANEDNYEDSHKLDWIFHQQVMELSEHNRLRDSYRLLAAQTRLFLSLTKNFHLDSQDILRLHEPIIEAMLSGKVELAADLMSKHITKDGMLLINSIKKQYEEEMSDEKL